MGMQIRWKVFIAGVLASAVFISLLIYLSVVAATDNIKKQVLSDNLAVATLAAELLEGKADDILTMAQSFAERPQVMEACKTKDVHLAEKHLKSAVKLIPGIDRSIILDTKGILWADYPSDSSLRGEDFSYRDYFKGVSSNGWKPYISEVYTRKAKLAKQVITAAAPVFNENGDPIGLIALQYPVQDFFAWIAPVNLGKRGSIIVLNKNGILIGRSHLDVLGSNFDYSGWDFFKKALTSKKGAAVVYDPITKEEQIAAYAYIETTGWVVIICQPIDVAFLEARLTGRRITSIGIAFFLMSAAFVFFAARGSFARGEYLKEITKKSKELEALAVNLEKMVSERTSELEGANRFLLNTKSAMINITEDLEKAGSELKKKQEELLITNENLRRLAQAKAEFVSIVSHELRTPLTAIKEAICLVLDGVAGKVGTEQGKFLSIARSNIDRLTFLINDILDFSKLEAGRMAMRRTKSDVNKIIEEAFEVFHVQATGRGVNIRLDLGDGLPEVWVDRDRVSQVITNLLSNAIKFVPEGKGLIKIKSWRESYDSKEWVLVSIEDNGPGIAASDIPKLFERFSQLDTTMTRTPGGTGLGLAISKNIVELHGGAIWAESTLGVGSKFIFRIPVYKKDIELNFLLDEAIERAKVNHIKASVIRYKLDFPASLKEEETEKVLLKAEDMIGELIRTPDDKVVRYQDHVFVAVLASADRIGASKITKRIDDMLKHELFGEKNGISFNAKVIVYPDDGATKEELLARLE